MLRTHGPLRHEIESALPQAEAFAYMADFANARVWDPSVSEARRVGEAPIGIGSAFDLVARFGGRDVPLRYEIVEYDSPRRVVLEARRPGFVSRDTITVEPAGSGSVVHYDATLAFGGARSAVRPGHATHLQSGRGSRDARDADCAELVTPSPGGEPRRLDAGGERRRQLHPDRLPHPAAPLRLDAAAVAPSRRQGRNRDRGDLGPRTSGRRVDRGAGRARLHRRARPGADRTRPQRDLRRGRLRGRGRPRRSLVPRGDRGLRGPLRREARPPRRARPERRRADPRVHGHGRGQRADARDTRLVAVPADPCAAASARGVGTVARDRGGIRRHVHRAARRRCPRPGTRRLRRDEDIRALQAGTGRAGRGVDARAARHRHHRQRHASRLGRHPRAPDRASRLQPRRRAAAPDAGGRSRHDRLAGRRPGRRGPQRPVLPRPASAGEAPPAPHAPSRRGP